MPPKNNNNNTNVSSDTAQGNNNNNQQQRQNKNTNNGKAKNGSSQRIGGDGPRSNPVSRSKRAVSRICLYFFIINNQFFRE
jgi:hypothetical protein